MGTVLIFPNKRKHPYATPPLHTLAEVPPNVTRLSLDTEARFVVLRRTPELVMALAVAHGVAAASSGADLLDAAQEFMDRMMAVADDPRAIREARELLTVAVRHGERLGESNGQ